MAKMPKGLWFEPPCPDWLQWRYYTEDIRWGWLHQSYEYRHAKDWTSFLDLPYPLALVPQFMVPGSLHDPLGDLENQGFDPGCCLCPVDLEKTAAENGFMMSKKDEMGEWDPFDTHFYEQGARP